MIKHPPRPRSPTDQADERAPTLIGPDDGEPVGQNSPLFWVRRVGPIRPVGLHETGDQLAFGVGERWVGGIAIDGPVGDRPWVVRSFDHIVRAEDVVSGPRRLPTPTARRPLADPAQQSGSQPAAVGSCGVRFRIFQA